MSVIAAKQTGFTIVELLIVIVVIAILATISIVAYNGTQNRANDAKMTSAAKQVEKALRIYAVDNGTVIKGGYGSTAVPAGSPCVDGSSGWFGSGSYACSVEDTLVASGLLPKGFSASLPANTYYSPATGGRISMMLYPCSGTGRYGLYWTLRSPSAADSASIDDTLSSCGNNVSIRDTNGMRAGKIVQF
jgi:general secretion pathway protein G